MKKQAGVGIAVLVVVAGVLLYFGGNLTGRAGGGPGGCGGAPPEDSETSADGGPNAQPVVAEDDPQRELGRERPAPRDANRCQWSAPLTGQAPYVLPLYVDGNATYWAMLLDRPDGEVEYRISGQFPRARFASLQTYDRTGVSLEALIDRDIEPLEDHVNPFRPGARRDAEQRSFEVSLVPGEADGPNQLGMGPYEPVEEDRRRDDPEEEEEEDPPAQNRIGLAWRVYLSDAVVAANRRSGERGHLAEAPGERERLTGDMLQGEVELPEVRAYDADGNPVPCGYTRMDPEFVESFTSGGAAFDTIPAADENGVLSMYRAPESNLYSNLGNAYLATRLRREDDAVVIFRARRPTFANTVPGGSEHEVFRDDFDMRYWSICMGGDQLTTTSYCVTDFEFPEAEFFTLVVGPETVRDRVPEEAVFVAWGAHTDPTLIYRHMLAKTEINEEGESEIVFQGAADLVDRSTPTCLGQAGQCVIEDYSPIGRHCTVASFLRQGLDCVDDVPPAIECGHPCPTLPEVPDEPVVPTPPN